ncbi:hypothetical protein ZIOFF_042204 [Zingiber officinale]|uniref:Uncharacterized protein n=1 Tax=Zingiber officinale TaxID=94328 RepID=A0A8J5GEP1_ZINOF|nr:hypothetical protein ZIOFF_042204 [Zingiber officinale]
MRCRVFSQKGIRGGGGLGRFQWAQRWREAGRKWEESGHRRRLLRQKVGFVCIAGMRTGSACSRASTFYSNQNSNIASNLDRSLNDTRYAIRGVVGPRKIPRIEERVELYVASQLKT